MFLEHGFEFSHETVGDWEERFTPLITQQPQNTRKGKAGKSWYADEVDINESACAETWHIPTRMLLKSILLTDKAPAHYSLLSGGFECYNAPILMIRGSANEPIIKTQRRTRRA